MRAELEHFVKAVYVEGHDVAGPPVERFRVRGFPTTLVLAADGTEVDRSTGYGGVAPFLAELRRIRAGEDTLKALLAVPEPWDLQHTLKLVAKLADVAPARAVTLCDAALAGEAPDEERATLMLTRAEALSNDEEYEAALRGFERLVRELPETEMGRIAGVHAVVALLNVAPDRALRFVLSAPRPEDPHAQRYLDNVLGNLHLQAAAACLTRQAEQWKDDAFGLNMVAWESYRHGLNTEAAIEWARRAVELSDRAPHVLDTLAHLLHRNEEVEEAIQLETEALESTTSDEERGQFIRALARFEADGALVPLAPGDEVVPAELARRLLARVEKGGAIRAEPLPPLHLHAGQTGSVTASAETPYLMDYDEPTEEGRGGGPILGTLRDGVWLRLTLGTPVGDAGEVQLGLAAQWSRIVRPVTRFRASTRAGPVTIQLPEARLYRVRADVRVRRGEWVLVGGWRAWEDGGWRLALIQVGGAGAERR